jgi:hypothetical protein
MDHRDNEIKSCECGNLCGGIQVPTEDELVALNAMRSVREKARVLSRQLVRLAGSPAGKEGPEGDRMRQELDRLKREWHEWERRKERAANERMILLGHEDPHCV